MAGATTSTSGIATIGAYQTSMDTALEDAFLTKFVINCSGFTAGTISGTTNVCPAAAITLTNTATGGVWSSSNTAIGTVGSASGIVTAISSGTTTISFTVTNACGTAYATQIITVNPSPSAGTISGPSVVCTSTPITLSDAAGSGTWSSSGPGIATVRSTGIVTGIAPGTATISFAATNACGTTYATQIITVNTLPSAGIISGPSVVCTGTPITLSDAAGSGTWSSSSAGIATVGSTGIVTGITTGTTTISFTVTNACASAYATLIVTVSIPPSAGIITGPSLVCTGATINLTDAISGGTWSSTSSSVATVGSSGIVTGVGTGTTTISYTETNACGSVAATAIVSVNVAPSVGAISGTLSVCSGLSTSLTDATTGGTWSSVSAGTASVGTSGTVTGISAGTSLISYTITTACRASAATAIVTVNTTPVATGISGPSAVCIGSSITLTDALPGGTWTSASTGIATVVGSTGVVTGVSSGSALISYTLSNLCGTATATTNIAVSTAPSAGTITGATNVCVTASVTLSDLVTGGTWNATNGHAFISSSGTVLGVTAGVDTMIYTVTSICATTTSATATLVITVNPAPNAGTITGSDSVCVSQSISLSDAVAGGTWTASNSNAFVSSSGGIFGVTAGTDNITYTTNGACGSANAELLVTIYDCSTGISNIPVSDYSPYPNPAQNSITITGSTNVNKVIISNVLGQEVFTVEYNSTIVAVNIDQLPAGIYLVRINDVKIYKLVKE